MSFLWNIFSRIQCEYQALFCKSQFSIEIWENADQKNCEFVHFKFHCSLESANTVWVMRLCENGMITEISKLFCFF